MIPHSTPDPAGPFAPLLDVPEEGALEAAGSRRWRELLGWSTTSAPVGLLLTAGLVVGPQGINLLSSGVLTILGPVIPVALAALGVLVGLNVGGRRWTGEPRTLPAASLAAAVTLAIVSAGLAAVAVVVAPADRPFWMLVLGGGIAAASSLTLPTADPAEPRPLATRIVERGVLLPIAAGGVLLAWLDAGSFQGAATLLAHASGVTLVLALAAWLLLSRASSDTEERVLAVSALLLVGGVAAALSLSALFGGLVAGALWRFAGRRPRETITRDVLFVQHPLVVLVLLAAGARADLSPAALVLGGGYLVLRVAGQLAAGSVAARVVGAAATPDLGRHLLAPGVFGVGFALNVAGVAGAEASPLLTAVVVGTIGAELVAALLPPRSVDR